MLNKNHSNSKSNKKTDIELNTNLQSFINKRKLEKGSKNYTNTSFSLVPEQNYIFEVKDNEYEKFIELYIKELETNNNLTLLEKPKDVGPLYFDFDIKHSNSESIITSEIYTNMVLLINSVIKKYVVEEEKENEDSDDETDKPNIYESYVLMKPKPQKEYKKELYSDGIHIHYPNLHLSVENRFLLFDEMKKKLIKKEVFKEIYDKLKDIDRDTLNNEIFDSCVIKKNGWFLYGSGKSNNKENKYKVVAKFNEDGTSKSIKKLTQEILVRKLSTRLNVLEEQKLDVSKEKMNAINEKYIKKKLSSDFFINKVEKQTEQITEKLSNLLKTKGTGKTEDIEYARQLVKLLSDKRAESYQDWITVGWALYNISPSLLKEFKEFSKKSVNKYQEGCCEKVWTECNSFHGSGYNIGNLVIWAKQDNSSGYDKLLLEKIDTRLTAGDIKTDYDVACIVHELYKYDYVCSSIGKNTWWEFGKHKWYKVDNAHTLNVKLSTDLVNRFAKLSSYYMEKSTQVQGQESDLYLKKSKDILELIKNLKKTAYKERLIKESCNLFYQKGFEGLLDQNCHLFGFNNGVYDLKNKIFRNGFSGDLTSKNTSYDYEEFTLDHPLIKQVNNFIKSIQPDEDMRNYLMCYCASFLEGGNKDQKFMIWLGSGSNGKGTLIDLLDKSFDLYFGTMMPTAITQKRGSSSGASPELANKHGIRLVCLQEIDEDEKLNVGFLKNITGQDKIECRALYSEPFQFVPLFKLLLACNHLPEVSSDDDGTWRRIRVVNFPIKFKSNPTGPNERASDSSLREKLPTWAAPFMWLLINVYYPMYCEKGLDKLEPTSVKLSTKKYKQNSNIYVDFIKDSLDSEDDIEKRKKSKMCIEKDTVWGMFKEWHANNYGSSKMPTQKKFIEFFENNGYPIKKKCIYGIEHKTQEEDEEE